MDITLESLGFTKEELQERVIARICAKLLEGVGYDEDDNEFTTASQFQRQMQARVREQIETTINTIAEREVLPNVATYIENLTLQETNRWGEKTGEKVTFIEYLTRRAEAYMQEKVNFDGKTKDEADSYSWSGTQTRITHLVHQHLHYSIDSAMKDALKIANSAIATGIQETVKTKLAEISTTLKVGVISK
ncbi:hypothetical protein [Stenotrophomonas forensis]